MQALIATIVCCFKRLLQVKSNITSPYAYLALEIQQEPSSFEIITEVDPLDVAELLGNIGGFWGTITDLRTICVHVGRADVPKRLATTTLGYLTLQYSPREVHPDVLSDDCGSVKTGNGAENIWQYVRLMRLIFERTRTEVRSCGLEAQQSRNRCHRALAFFGMSLVMPGFLISVIVTFGPETQQPS